MTARAEATADRHVARWEARDLCTPHRGSFLALPHIIRRLIEPFVRLP